MCWKVKKKICDQGSLTLSWLKHRMHQSLVVYDWNSYSGSEHSILLNFYACVSLVNWETFAIWPEQIKKKNYGLCMDVEIVLERFLVVTLIGCYYVSKNPKPNVATNQLRQCIYKNLYRATHFYPFIV